jgi:hypothetical protein
MTDAIPGEGGHNALALVGTVGRERDLCVRFCHGKDAGLVVLVQTGGQRFGRCDLSTQRYDANLLRCFGPERAEWLGRTGEDMSGSRPPSARHTGHRLWVGCTRYRRSTAGWRFFESLANRFGADGIGQPREDHLVGQQLQVQRQRPWGGSLQASWTNFCSTERPEGAGCASQAGEEV